MAAAIYTQGEVDGMITMPKRIPFDDWQSKHGLRSGTLSGRAGRIRAAADDPAINAVFTIAADLRPQREEYSITMIGSLGSKPEVELCRYDLQNIGHGNGDLCLFRDYVLARQPHRHVHCVACVRRRGNRQWDDCAEILKFDSNGAFTTVVDRIVRAFILDLDIRIEDKEMFETFKTGHAIPPSNPLSDD